MVVMPYPTCSQQPCSSYLIHTEWLLHRVWTVKYNRCHDQLLLSGGTDSLVNLWRVSSISSAPLIEADDPARYEQEGLPMQLPRPYM